MTKPTSHRWSRPVIAGGVAAVLAAVVLTFAGATALRPAQAAPVPSTQTSCPPPVDPRPIAVTTGAYARIDGIPGDATRSGVAGQIPLTAIRSALIAGGSGLCGGSGGSSGGGAGLPSFDPVVVEKRVDRASVRLLANAAAGAHIATARISVWSETGTPRQVLSYDLTDVTVLYVRQVHRFDSLTEEVALGFRRIAWSFTSLNPDGTPGTTITACWDRPTNRTC